MKDEQVLDLFLDFFRFDKGYEWGDEEIFSSANPDDLTEFLVKIRDVLVNNLDRDATQISINRRHTYKSHETGENIYYNYGTSTNMKQVRYNEKGDEI